MRLRCAILTLVGVGCVLLPGLARAQAFDQYLSPTVPGYDTLRGLEIPQRPRTEYDPLGIQVGQFNIRPQFDTGVGYDTNVLGTNPPTGSFYLNEAPQVFINSQFGGVNNFAANFGLDNFSYTDQKTQSHTDWNASIGGTYQIGQDLVTGTASEIYAHENPTDINSATILRPLGFKVTDLRLNYETQLNYWNVQPNFDYQGYRFDRKLEGAAVSQTSRDRDDFTGGLTIRFGKIPERSFVLVLQGTNSHFIASQGEPPAIAALIPRPDSANYEVLGGVEYAFSANLQVLLLGGYDLQTFTNRAYAQITSPVFQAVAIWAPSGLTTLTGKLTRTIEDTIGQTTSGVTVTQGGLTVDHEYQRNILLQGRVSAINTLFVGNQNQTIYDFGGSLSYLFSRNMRLTATYDYFLSTGNTVNQLTIIPTAIGGAATSFISLTNYNRQVALVSLRFTL